MPRIARPHAQERFDLYPDNPDEKRLIDYLSDLAKSGQQRQWIVSALLRQLERETEQPPDFDPKRLPRW